MAAEGNESFQIQIRTGSISGPIVATSSTITVVDTPSTYTVSQTATSVNEGGSVTFTLTTTNVVNGTIIYWNTSGTASAADFTDGVSTGSVTINNNTGSITRSLSNDATTEGSETFVIRFYEDASRTVLVATSSTVTIGDTSPTPTPTYSITPASTSVNEGQQMTWTISTTNFGSGTLYWTNSGSTTGADFTDGLNSGSISITNNTGTLTKTLSADLTTDPSETITIQLRTGSTSGTVVQTSSTVTVVDTSPAPPPTTSVPPPTTSAPPPTTSAPPPTTSAPPPVAPPALSITIAKLGVAAFTAPSPSTNPTLQFGFSASGMLKVRIRRTDSYGVSANYALSTSPGSRRVSSNYGAGSVTGTISAGQTLDFYLPGDLNWPGGSITITITASGYQQASATTSLSASTYYGWSELSTESGTGNAGYYAGTAVDTAYSSGPWVSTRFIVNGSAYYGLSRKPEKSGAQYWISQKISNNLTDTQIQTAIVSSALSQGSGGDYNAVKNGSVSWYTGTGFGPMAGIGSPGS